MHVLAVSVDTLPKMGGVSMMTHHFCNALCYLGHDVALLGPRGSYVPAGYDRQYGLIEDWESDVKRRSGPKAPQEDARIRAVLHKALVRYGSARLLLFHPFYYGVGSLQAAKDLGVPHSAYFHGYELQSQLRHGVPSDMQRVCMQKGLKDLPERTFCVAGAADEVLVNSSFTARLLQALPLQRQPRVTGCGVADVDFQQELALSPTYCPEQRRQRRAQLGLGDPMLLTYVGRLIEPKRADRLIHMVAANAGMQAALVGDGDQAERLRRLAASLKVEQRVHFLGPVGEQDKWKLLRASDFGCLLSEPREETGQVEGFGIALLEAAAAGAVPVTSGTGGMAEVVEHDATGLYVDQDDAAAAAQLAATYAQQTHMKRLVSQAREQLRERFQWTRVASRAAAGWS